MFLFKFSLSKTKISYNAETLLSDKHQHLSLQCTEQRSCPEIITRKLHLVPIDAGIFCLSIELSIKLLVLLSIKFYKEKYNISKSKLTHLFKNYINNTSCIHRHFRGKVSLRQSLSGSSQLPDGVLGSKTPRPNFQLQELPLCASVFPPVSLDNELFFLYKTF